MAATRRKTAIKPLKSPVPGDWVAHVPGAPKKIYAIAISLKSIEASLKEQDIALEDVAVYQVPAADAASFIGEGVLRLQSDTESEAPIFTGLC